MASKVIDLDDRRPIWATSRARCGACGHRWVAVWPAGSSEAKDYGWECPSCAQMAGVECPHPPGLDGAPRVG